jgi:outer membrane protein assembly factor BamB
MTTGTPTPRKGRPPLRLWPGITLAILLLVGRFGLPLIAPTAAMYGIMGGLAASLLIVLWWLLFSRAPWAERLGAIASLVLAVAAAPAILDESIRNGAMGMLFYLLAVPVLAVVLVAWATSTHRWSTGARRVAMVVAPLLVAGSFALIRTGGFTGDGDSDFHWRWTATPEERLLAQAGEDPVPPPVPAPVVEETLPPQPAVAPGDAAPPAPPSSPEAADSPLPAEVPAALPSVAPAFEAAVWPGFRGPDRNGVAQAAAIATDWAQSPPAELWRRPIGPGWSSFAVQGDRLFTQEQRGEEEVVAAYDLATGEPLWLHRDPVRFWESNAGAGPRGTPTLNGDRVYTFGATGILNALEAGDGAPIWSRDVANDTGKKVPGWGFASSPLVVDDLVVIGAAGRLAAYDLSTGELRWLGPEGGWGYASPQLETIDGVTQILLLNGAGAIGVAPQDGGLLWMHEWHGDGILQPSLTADGDILIGTATGMGEGAGIGTRRIAIDQVGTEWTIAERWTSTGLKPYFSDFVVHEGYAYGFDGSILACISLENGERQWKGGRYGHGQLVLLPEQDLLLVLSERGEVALVAAAPDGFTELARFPVIEGKTWNHPVLAGDLLLVRNGEEMVALRLPPPDPSLESAAGR